MYRSAAVIWIACSIVSGQPPNAGEPAFEVASVKFVSSGPIQVPPGQIVFSPLRPVKLIGDRVSGQETLSELIRLAYQLGPHQIVGPGWLSDRRYQVTAIVPPGTTKDAVPAMMRRLLSERLGLKVHWEDRVQSVRALLVVETGHKLIEVQDWENAPKRDVKVAGTTLKTSVYASTGQFFAAAMDLGTLAENLSVEFEEPVVNATGLDKHYRIDARWTPNTRPDKAPGSTGSDSEFPRALLKQLGLRLEKQRLPKKMLIVEHTSLMPTEN